MVDSFFIFICFLEQPYLIKNQTKIDMKTKQNKKAMGVWSPLRPLRVLGDRPRRV